MAERLERELLGPSASDLDLLEMAAHRASVLVDILLARLLSHAMATLRLLRFHEVTTERVGPFGYILARAGRFRLPPMFEHAPSLSPVDSSAIP